MKIISKNDDAITVWLSDQELYIPFANEEYRFRLM